MVFSNCVSEEIGDGTNVLLLPDAITGVDDNNNVTNITDLCEYPYDRVNNTCGDHDDRADKTVDNVEVESDNANDRTNNIGLVVNY